jgi:hypothetical protein
VQGLRTARNDVEYTWGVCNKRVVEKENAGAGPAFCLHCEGVVT